MPYVLPDSFLTDLRLIRKNYERDAGIKLNEASAPYKVSIFLGATDVKARRWQIQFVENWLKIFAEDLKPLEPSSSEDSIKNHIEALRFLVAICIFIKSQIDVTYIVRKGSNATLTTLIDEALKLDKNSLDDETRACCLFSAQLFLSQCNLEAISRKYNVKFQDSSWRKFLNFVTTECKELEEVHPASYPITSILMPALSIPMGLLGNTTGYIVGDALGKSALFLSTRYTITAAIGSGLLFLIGPGASVGILLLAPTYAGKLLDTFCGVSFAYLMGTVMGAAGASAGWVIGMSLDATWKLLYQACCVIGSACEEEPRLPPLTGFTLVDPRRIIGGCEITVTEGQPDVTPGYQQLPVFFENKNNGLSMFIDGEEVVTPTEYDNPAYKAITYQLEAIKPDRVVDLSMDVALYQPS
jgi:hypothetical protein